MSSESTDFIVVTGGPGAGKTSLVDRLRSAGYATAEEAGRGIIQDQVAIGGRALPWIDPDAFAELMTCWEMRSYRIATQERRTVFFDRGLPDIIGYLRLEGRPVPDHIHVAAQSFRYHSRVFIAPPWQDIYERDDERHQTFEKAQQTYEAMVASYTELGYQLTELSRSSTEERSRFVLGTLHLPADVTPKR